MHNLGSAVRAPRKAEWWDLQYELQCARKWQILRQYLGRFRQYKMDFMDTELLYEGLCHMNLHWQATDSAKDVTFLNHLFRVFSHFRKSNKVPNFSWHVRKQWG